MTKLDDLEDAVRRAVLAAMDDALGAEYGKTAFPRDEDLPELFKALDAATVACLRRVYVHLPEQLDLEPEVVARTAAQLADARRVSAAW